MVEHWQLKSETLVSSSVTANQEVQAFGFFLCVYVCVHKWKDLGRRVGPYVVRSFKAADT